MYIYVHMKTHMYIFVYVHIHLQDLLSQGSHIYIPISYISA